MTIQVITLFPEMFEGVLGTSMLLKAQKKGIVNYRLINLRDFGVGSRKRVDDIPYGGGDGMVLKPEPLFAAIEYAKTRHPESTVLLMTPRGKIFDQKQAKQLTDNGTDIVIVCGRYEGYDERITQVVDLQISIGEFVLTGGELPAMIVIDALTRLMPGVLGGELSAELESYSKHKEIEHPHYTRPAEFRGIKVPDVLINGNHKDIESWRRDNEL
jgi:tRNA (guanine37-N1)-methyltransferase